MKINNRGKRLMIAIAMFVVIIIIAKASQKPTYKDYTVHKGDTLWSIAVRECHNKCDVRIYIDEVKDINDVDEMLEVGTHLKLREVK